MNEGDNLSYLQEMFSGKVDPDVVKLVLIECQQKVDDAVMQLLTLTEGTKTVSDKNVGFGQLSNKNPSGDLKKNKEQHSASNLPPKLQTEISSSQKITHVSLTENTGIKEGRHDNVKRVVSPSSSEIDKEIKRLSKCIAKNETQLNDNFNTISSKQNSRKLPVNSFHSLKPRIPYSVVDPNLRHSFRPGFVLPQNPMFVQQHQLRGPGYPPGYPPGFRPPLIRAHGRPFRMAHQLNGTVIQHRQQRPQFGNQHRPPSPEKRQCDDKTIHHNSLINGYPHTVKQDNFSIPLKKLIILRGLPGSGKSTLARMLAANGGVIISTDDYFLQGGRYNFNPLDLSAAHEWNQSRAKKFMEKGFTPVIIDNTNTQAWEMKPYVSIGLRCGYNVDIREPETGWKWNIKELLRRNKHGVTPTSLRNMMERYEKNLTVESVMKSHRPTMVKSDNDEKQSSKNSKENKLNGKDKPVSNKPSNGGDQVLDSKIKNSVVPEKATLSPNSPNTVKHSSITSGVEGNAAEQLFPGIVETSEIKKGLVHVSELEHECSVKQGLDKQTNGDPMTVELVKDNDDDRSEERSTDLHLLNILKGNHDSSDDKHKHDVSLEKENGANPSFLSNDERGKDKTTDLDHLLSTSILSDISSLRDNYFKYNPRRNLGAFSSDYGLPNVSPCVTEGSREGATKQPVNSHVLPNVDKPVLPNSCRVSRMDDVEGQQLRNVLPVQSQGSPHIGGEELYVDNFEDIAEEMVQRGSENMEDMVSNSPAVVNDEVSSDKSETANTSKSVVSMETSHASDTSSVEADGTQVKILDNIENRENTGSLSTPVASKESCAQGSSSALGNEASESPNPMTFLLDCFSHISVETLKMRLNRCDGDLMRTVDSLIDYSEDDDFNDNNSDEFHQTSSAQAETEDTSQSYSPSPKGSTNLGVDFEYGKTKSLHDYATEKETTDKKDLRSDTPVKSNSLSSDFQDISISSLHLTLDPALALQLLEIFGSFSGVSPKDTLSEDALSVEIDQEFAKILYSKWRKTIQKKRKISEVTRAKQSSASPKNSKRMYKTPPREFNLPSDVKFRPKNQVSLTEPVSLKEIMDEQLAIHVSKSDKEVEKSWKEENLDLSTKLKRSRLHGMFPGIDETSLNEIFEANNYNLDQTIHLVQASIGGDPSVFQQPTNEKKTKPVTDVPYTVPGSQRTEGTCKTDGNYQSFQDPTYKDYRAEAETHFKLRGECIKKAALAYSKKQGELARVYGEQARVHGERLKEANRRAAEKILKARNNDLQITNELDLHELHVSEAIEVLQTVLEERKRELRSPNRKSPSCIQVITGRGNRSRDGKARIKPAVVNYLKRNGYRFEELNMGLYRVYFN